MEILYEKYSGRDIILKRIEDTEKMNVVYLRKDEKYGLIVPKE